MFGASNFLFRDINAADQILPLPKPQVDQNTKAETAKKKAILPKEKPIIEKEEQIESVEATTETVEEKFIYPQKHY